jgi:hypothetical protein
MRICTKRTHFPLKTHTLMGLAGGMQGVGGYWLQTL